MVRFISLSLNEKGPFLWSAYRITEKQKAGKAQNIKGKQLKNSRSTASKPPVALRSSPSANFPYFSVRLTTSICRKIQYFWSCAWSSKVVRFAS